jgi:nitric oxide reductase NorD protein
MRGSAGADEELQSLGLVASAIAGRTMEVAAATAGTLSWSDGRTVFLERGASPGDAIRMLAVQASLVACGSLEPDVIGPLARRRVLARRYLAVEGHRALLANEHVLPPLARSLIDRDLAASVGTAAASLEMARHRHTIDEPPRVFGVIDVRRALTSIHRTAELPFGRSSEMQRQPVYGATADLPDDEDGDDVADLLTSPVGGGGVGGSLLIRMLRPARRRAGGGPLGANSPTRYRSTWPGSRRDAVASSTSMGEFEATWVIDVEPVHMAYPEWDVTRGRYRMDWCTVLEADARSDAGSTMQLPSGLAMRRSLARLGTGRARFRRQAQGDDVDIDAAVEAHIDTLAGVPHRDDGYVDYRRRRRDLTVLVLLDVSGSAGEPGMAGTSVHEHQRLAAAALTAALHDLGDRVALYAFNSRGRRAVQLLRVKGFDDSLDVQMSRRLSALEPAAYTRLGAAVRHGANLLDRRSGTARRLLVVLSDGLAYDHGYAGRYGEADARRALTEARRRGVGCLCLSVGTNAEPEALRRVFGSAAQARVSGLDALPALIAPLFRAALRSAEGQHRAFQRKQRTRERLEIDEEMR